MEYGKVHAITAELEEAAKQVDEAQVEALADAVIGANRIFCAGAGRSGFAARAFSNRLLHLGMNVSFVGEPTTPPIAKGDLLVVGSGSGRTAGLIVMAEKAREAGADIATVTLAPENTIGQMAEVAVKLPGTTRLAMDTESNVESIQIPGSMFEQLSWITYDAVVLYIIDKLGISEEEMVARHANLE